MSASSEFNLAKSKKQLKKDSQVFNSSATSSSSSSGSEDEFGNRSKPKVKVYFDGKCLNQVYAPTFSDINSMYSKQYYAENRYFEGPDSSKLGAPTFYF